MCAHCICPYLVVEVHLRRRAGARRDGLCFLGAGDAAHVVGSLEINEVLQVGRDKEEARAIDVVEVAMTGRAERNGVIGVAKMREGYETLLNEVWERAILLPNDMADASRTCAAVLAGGPIIGMDYLTFHCLGEVGGRGGTWCSVAAFPLSLFAGRG